MQLFHHSSDLSSCSSTLDMENPDQVVSRVLQGIWRSEVVSRINSRLICKRQHRQDTDFNRGGCSSVGRGVIHRQKEKKFESRLWLSTCQNVLEQGKHVAQQLTAAIELWKCELGEWEKAIESTWGWVHKNTIYLIGCQPFSVQSTPYRQAFYSILTDFPRPTAQWVIWLCKHRNYQKKE